MLRPMSLLNPEFGQGPGVNAGLWESHGVIKVSEGQGWRTEAHGQRKDHYDYVNPYSISPAPLSSAACIPRPQPGVLLPPASPSLSVLSILSGDRDASSFPVKVLIPRHHVIRWRWKAGNGEQRGAEQGWRGDPAPPGLGGVDPAVWLPAKPQLPACALSRLGDPRRFLFTFGRCF